MNTALLLLRRLLPLAGLLCLVFGVYIGLIKLGWSLPTSPSLISLHAPLMICGFLGTVISLERAVAIEKPFAYLSPIFSGIGALVLIADLSWGIGVFLIALASFLLCIVSFWIYSQQKTIFNWAILFASVLWCVGCALWLLGFSIIQILPCWMGFLILTIFGERLELSRFLPTSKNKDNIFMVLVSIYAITIFVTSLHANFNFQLFSAALLIMTLWLLYHDVIKHAIKQHGITRYIAVALLLGYFWLIIAALIGLTNTHLNSGSSFDAFTHCIFIGFVFSMIFGHAPIIFPAITKIKMHYHPAFYFPLILLHISLMIRLCGDFFFYAELRKISGGVFLIAMLFFLATVALSSIVAKGDLKKLPH